MLSSSISMVLHNPSRIHHSILLKQSSCLSIVQLSGSMVKLLRLIKLLYICCSQIKDNDSPIIILFLVYVNSFQFLMHLSMRCYYIDARTISSNSILEIFCLVTWLFSATSIWLSPIILRMETNKLPILLFSFFFHAANIALFYYAPNKVQKKIFTK